MLFWIFFLSTIFSTDSITITDGYVWPMSVLPGDSLQVYLNTEEKKSNRTIHLYDMDGNEVASYKGNVSPQQPVGNAPWETGYGYKPTLRIIAPKLKSGVYLWERKIPLIIRAVNPKIIVVYTSNTENAYCNAGGKGLYAYNSTDRVAATTVSFKRPINPPKHSEQFLKWFVKQRFSDVGYIIDSDLDSFSEIRRADLLIIPGHNEYWSYEGRKNFDRFVGEGKDALVLSGNTMWWQVRYNKNKDQLICYKLEEDPVKSKKLKTVNWDNGDLAYSILSSLGADFPRAGYGRKEDKGWDGYKLVNSSPLLEGTKLKPGDILPLPSDEADGAPINGFDANGYPIIDHKALGFEQVELVGFDHTFRIQDGVATWIVFRKTKSSGIIINVASTDWCSSQGITNSDIQRITINMITKLLHHENVFSTKSKHPVP